MCDYSLHAELTRLAAEGEQLVVARFPGGSQGLTSEEDYQRDVRERPASDGSFLRRVWRSLAGETLRRSQPCMTAVCVPPGARLRLEGFSPRAQEQFGVPACVAATFEQVSCDPYTYRDAVRLESGRVVSLQILEPGLRAQVVSLDLPSEPMGALHLDSELARI